MAKGPRKETRSEHQRFLTGLQERSVEERERLQKEHKAYLAGERDQDVSFDREPVPTRRPALHRPPPLGKDFAYLQAQKRLISQQHRAVAAKTVAGSGRKAPVARKTKEQDEDYVPDEEEDLTPPRKKQKGARSTEAKKKVVKKTAVAKTKKTTAGTKKDAPKKPRNSTNAKAKEKEAKTAAAVKRCLASAAAEVEGAAAHKAARERLNNQASKSTDAANTTDDIASALTGRMATTHQSDPVLHDQYPTSQEQDYTTFQRDTSTEDLLEIREPSDERAQPNAPVAELPEDESISTGTTGSGFLDSDCEDTEAEICFLDDDDELERARSETTSVNTADESSFLSDSEAESNHDDDADSNDQDCAESLADSHSTRVKCVTEARNGSFREGSQQYGRNASKWVDTKYVLFVFS
ncbi:hypothetical protein F444_16883 [Phytophthora nicotianae P1976]|uniref:Uncharacterized protein n=1 Tax=Phytophthora nicotianae P1976 TaxID=1317066 RepID=A0A080ZGU4_PHYNI|nr:hypothetical protein F444_16883 [Phytophthora nicotianae P1976]